MQLSATARAAFTPTRPSARLSVRASAWTKLATVIDVKNAGSKLVVEAGGQKLLLVEVADEVFAVSNKCSHLNLSLVGKTPLLQAKITDKCVVCPAHGTAFDLATGAVQGEWCPGFPDLPLVGKMKPKAPLPTFQSRVDEAGNIEVLV